MGHAGSTPRFDAKKEQLHFTAPRSLGDKQALQGALEKPATIPKEDCPICLEDFSSSTGVVQIKACGHAFHLECIKDCINRESRCPICRVAIGEPQGKAPSGSMNINLLQDRCPGFGHNTTTIEISYDLPGGTQMEYHENPGQRYHGTNRVAYLPSDQDGCALLARLKYAFMHGLCFAVGTSLTSGQNNVVVWTSIHHKTSLHGGTHGFPDPNYIYNCNESLDALNVPPAQDCVAYFGKPSSPPQPVINSVPAPAPTLVPFIQNEVLTYNAPTSISKRIRVSRRTRGCPQGEGPSGTMSISFLNHDCPGYQQGTKTIVIKYNIPSGIQMSYHYNPGQPYDSTRRETYLPLNTEGSDLLKRLKVAWMHGLLFSVGVSATTGQANVVIWSAIPQKSSLRGSPFGFPDPAYAATCHAALDRAGVPHAANC